MCVTLAACIKIKLRLSLYAQPMWMRYSQRLASQSIATSLYSQLLRLYMHNEREMCVTLAAYIKIKLRSFVRNRCGCYTLSGLHEQDWLCICIRKQIYTCYSEAAYAFICAPDVDVLLPVAYINKNSNVFIYTMMCIE